MKRFTTLSFVLCVFILLLSLASCNKVVFKINFVVDGEIYDSITTQANKTISMPQNPTKEEYIFDGWFWDEGTWEKAFTANSLLDAPLSSDMNVYAKWTHIHTASEWIIDKPATCIEEGKKHTVCIGCDEIIETVTINISGTHTIGNTSKENIVNATCNDKGSYEEVVFCAFCNTEMSRVYKETDSLGHIEVIDTSIAPTCTAKGLTEGKHCSRCTETIIAQTVLDALGHAEVIDVGTAPTCTQSGVSDGKHCSRCKEILVAQTVVDELGHDYEAVIVEPTVLQNGSAKYTCSICSDSYTDIIIPMDFTITAENRNKIGFMGTSDENLVIPDIFQDEGAWYKVVTIGNYAFGDCSKLKTVVIPESVTKIERAAFANCRRLTSVNIPSGVTTIEMATFACCDDLMNVELPNTLTTIGRSAFGHCFKMTNITLPNSITKIDVTAFEWCESLEVITFKGTIEQWNAIEQTTGWENVSNFEVHFTN